MIGIDWAQKDANFKEKTRLKRENKIHSRFKFIQILSMYNILGKKCKIGYAVPRKISILPLVRQKS